MYDLDHPRGMTRERGIGAVILVAFIAFMSLCHNRGRTPPATTPNDAGAPAPSRSH